jgi:hypothetical protein
MTPSCKWTPEEDALLREIASRGSRADAVREIGRTVIAVKQRARRLRLRFAARDLGGPRAGTTARYWTRAEDQAIRLMVGHKSMEAIGRELGRSRDAIISRVTRLGLGNRYKQGRLTLEEAGRILGCTGATVGKWRDRLGRRWARGNGAEPGMEPEDVALVARAMLARGAQVKTRAPVLRRIAEGELPAC